MPTAIQREIYSGNTDLVMLHKSSEHIFNSKKLGETWQLPENPIW